MRIVAELDDTFARLAAERHAIAARIWQEGEQAKMGSGREALRAYDAHPDTVPSGFLSREEFDAWSVSGAVEEGQIARLLMTSRGAQVARAVREAGVDPAAAHVGNWLWRPLIAALLELLPADSAEGGTVDPIRLLRDAGRVGQYDYDAVAKRGEPMKFPPLMLRSLSMQGERLVDAVGDWEGIWSRLVAGLCRAVVSQGERREDRKRQVLAVAQGTVEAFDADSELCDRLDFEEWRPYSEIRLEMMAEGYHPKNVAATVQQLQQRGVIERGESENGDGERYWRLRGMATDGLTEQATEGEEAGEG